MKIFWASWQAFGHFMGNLLGRVAMTIFYFTIFAPFGLAVSLAQDPLQIKQQRAENWVARETGDQTLPQLLRQF